MGETWSHGVGDDVGFGKRILCRTGRLVTAETARWARLRQTLLKEKLTSYLFDFSCCS